MFFYTFIPKLLNMSLTASVAIVLVLLLRLMLKKAPKVISYALWSVVLFRLLCPVSIESSLSLFGLLDTPTVESTTLTSSIEYVPENIVHRSHPDVTLPVPGVSDAINNTLPSGREQLVADPLEAPVAIGAYVWMMGVLCMAVYSIISCVRLRRKLLTVSPLRDNILLADEINRATPRTQSALLECMEERQITEGGTTYVLEDPFLVIATQNPVESQGTFPLPEAQLDRFLMRLSLGYPTHEEAVHLLRRFLNSQPLSQIESVAAREELRSAAVLCGRCHVSEDVMGYMASLCEAARDPEKVRLGPSPRALLALMRACQAYAAIHGRDFVIPDDVKALAIPVLAHRILLRGLSYQNSAESFLRTLLDTVPAPTEKAL